jgi:hypothetical protein
MSAPLTHPAEPEDDTARPAWTRLPVVGIGLFVVLYALAAALYPGGSTADPATPGFDWSRNYWCDLMGEQAKNGTLNPARPVAAAAMAILCPSLAVFWAMVPAGLRLTRTWQRVIRTAGIASMAVIACLALGGHDAVINAAGLLGALAMAGTLLGMNRTGLHGQFAAGLVCAGLIVANNAIYHYGIARDSLPVVQKLTFVIALGWVAVATVSHGRRLAAERGKAAKRDA